MSDYPLGATMAGTVNGEAWKNDEGEPTHVPTFVPSSRGGKTWYVAVPNIAEIES